MYCEVCSTHKGNIESKGERNKDQMDKWKNYTLNPKQINNHIKHKWSKYPN